ncbi:copper chaperone PCu(A)C [Streptomyces sp. NPDC001880]
MKTPTRTRRGAHTEAAASRTSVRDAPRRATRSRLRESLTTGVTVLLACVTALCGLAAWTTAGYAGRPARIEVLSGHVLLPVLPGRATNAYFRITNTGGAPDRLLSATVSAAGRAELTAHRMTPDSGAYRESVDDLTVPAGTELTMSPFGPAVTVAASPTWRTGDRITFTLGFERSGPVTVEAVVRPPTEAWAW